jgi:hypothetical protein
MTNKSVRDPYAEYARRNLLDDISTAIPAREAEKEVTAAKGLYFIMVKDITILPQEIQNHQTAITLNEHVIYIGKAANNDGGLRQRLALQDLQHKGGPSTFFRSIGAVLGYRPTQNPSANNKNHNYRFSLQDTENIREWINSNLYVKFIEIPDNLIDSLERGLIKSFKPCCNIFGNPKRCQYVVGQRKICMKHWCN